MGVVFDGGVRMFYTRPSDQKTYCFDPVPLLGETKEFLKTDAGRELAIIHTLSFNGTLLPTLPSLSGIPDQSTCISILDRKRDQIAQALSEDRGDLLIVDQSGYPIVSTKPIVRDLSFEEGTIVNLSRYSFSVEYEEILDSDFPVRSFDDNWSFSQNENDVISATHDVSAVGIEDVTLGKKPHIVAKDFVLARLGFDVSQSFVFRTPVVNALLDVTTLSPFNRVFSETSSITAGSYQVSESFILSSGNFQDDRTISEEFQRDDEGALVGTVSIDGTVQGYGDTTFEKIENAIAGFDSFVAAEIGFNSSDGVESKSKTTNRIGGTVSYSIVKVPESGGLDDLVNKQISRSFDRNDDGSVVQTVSTAAQVRPSSASGIELAVQYCFDNNFPINSAIPAFDVALSGNLLSVSTERDDVAKSFSLNRVFVDQNTLGYTEEYQTELSRGIDTSQISISIQGSIQGLGNESTTKSEDRFAIASGAYFNIVEPLISSRVSALIPSGSCISAQPVTQSLGYVPLGGAISYNQTFESRIKTSNPDILVESIEVSFQRPAQVIASIPIPGKPDGPILQDQETVTGRQKTLNVSYTMKNTDSTCGNTIIPSNLLLETAIAESNILVDNTPTDNVRGEKPESSKVFKTQDSINFSRQSNQFTRNVTWQYI